MILKVTNFEIVPDYLNLSALDSKNYFPILIGSTASIFGVLIAIILLTFEFVRNKAFRRKDENILTNPVATNLVSTAVAVIILSFLSYSTIDNFEKSNNLSIAYFLGFLFVGFIISIFPAAKSILETANVLKKTKEKIQNLTLENFSEVLSLENNKLNLKNNDLALFRIRQELITTVRECDYEAYTTMLEDLNNKAIELIGKGEDQQQTEIVFQGVTFIWRAGNFEAHRVGNLQFFEVVWESIERLYEYAAKERIDLLHYNFIDIFMGEYIRFLTKHKLSDTLSTGVNALLNIFKQNLKFNCPSEEEIHILSVLYSYDNKGQYRKESGIQWERIISYLSRIQDIQSSAIENEDKELFEKSAFELSRILSEIGNGDFSNLKSYQEAYIVHSVISSLVHNGYTANEANLFKDTVSVFKINTDFISNIIKNERFYTGRTLEKISDFIINSQRKEQLNDYYTLNFWGGIGRYASQFYFTNETAQKTVDYVIDTFEKLKKEIEENQLPSQAKNYNEIKEQLKWLKSWLEKIPDEKVTLIIERTEKIISEFKVVAVPSDSRIVKWKNQEKTN